ncbi:helix-turn-helix domain-containing protein [Streptomyces sp. OM5714]|uniref:helix-turn-helix transcriptional regulator n=1 Tax=Streptomyces sp. OM5714 TaxID=2602736 RepID=UPI0013DA87C5|nr:helix-turn-helix domain-containing protein [Streptomyces sp. OM5714]KAF2778583.1 regulatory protein MerR [Streptomyces sp. OM5714]
MPEQMLTPAQVAAEYGVAVRTLANWRYLGIGPKFVKLTQGRSGRVRYSRADVDAWISQQKGQAAA